MSLTQVEDRSIEHFLRWMKSEGIEFSKSFQPLEMKELISDYEEVVAKERQWLASGSLVKFADN